ncbi:hypothetical protein KVV02_003332 [Mortierella alpina]|uniref:Transcription activator GCR1-like domain-containing protein n=1 Tax=Mortierella alpina TaxID=64518 RepID=A0A9P8CTR3_MORAP|nr:hypothetical protein KVV02_003332 [Mortierella alpina]
MRMTFMHLPLASSPFNHRILRTFRSTIQPDAVEDIVLQISNKAIADGLSVDRVYEFMEKVGETMVRTARREGRCPPGQQQQQPLQSKAVGQSSKDQNLKNFETMTSLSQTTLSPKDPKLPPRTLDDVDPTILPRSVSLETHWEEWFKGADGRPSLWILNKSVKPKWRQRRGNTLTKTFSFKKAIITAVLKVEALSSQTVPTSFSNFEDVFGKGDIYDHTHNEAPAADGNTEEATVDMDGIEDRVITSKSASGQTTANNPRYSRKRKSAESGPDYESVFQNTRRKGKQPIYDAPRQLLEDSHLISDALRINEFAEWCDRKRYPNYLVTKTKFQVFMSENLAEDTDEENDIRPLRAYRERMEKARNPPGFNKNDYLPKADTVDQYVKALVDLYETQKAKDPVAMAGQDHPRTAGIKALLRNYWLRLGDIAKSAHAETLTVGDGYDVDFLKEIMRVGWTYTYQASATTSNNRRSGHVGLRNRLSLCWCHFMMCRGENMRMAMLCDISSYMFRHNSQDGHYSLGVTLSMLQWKTNREGKENYGVVVRNKDVEICPDPGDLPF